MKITIDLTEAQASELQRIAAPLGITPKELAEATIPDLLTRCQDDFQAAAMRVLEKNRELYDRLG